MKFSKKTLKELFKKQNVNGVFYGSMTKNGEYKGKGVIVTVKKKLPKSELKRNDIIPSGIDDHLTDVIEVGEIKALIDRKAMHRPFPMGVSCGHWQITAGTAGCLVKKQNDLNTYLLSNNHVLARVNEASIGDTILQQGTYDGGNATINFVGKLAQFVKIKFPGTGCNISSAITKILNIVTGMIGSGVSFSYKKESFDTSATNKVDCAIAELQAEVANPMLVDLGYIETVANANPGDRVWKSGRTTGTTEGEVIATDYVTQVNMGDGKIATFDDQILIKPVGAAFSAGGDSGSAIVKKNKNGNCNIVGLLFAGSDTVTVANKISNVFSALNIVL